MGGYKDGEVGREKAFMERFISYKTTLLLGEDSWMIAGMERQERESTFRDRVYYECRKSVSWSSDDIG